MKPEQIINRFKEELLNKYGIHLLNMNVWQIKFSFADSPDFIGYFEIVETGDVALGTETGHTIGVTGLKECINVINHIETTDLIELWGEL
ncbi:hypothetical protein [Culicoidibacter larvae]|uniref:Uncharacterized protein n=1 Tax=Culicoidibacter larvae TaxID=2579976 RepID=A0A5R8Q8X6_9FIRM|nr:hypothetical protein [Culicoidibacter larvae]TLG72075.1 hypothetical protein FEZ08_09590 [Culicoidibacter larvae]